MKVFKFTKAEFGTSSPLRAGLSEELVDTLFSEMYNYLEQEIESTLYSTGEEKIIEGEKASKMVLPVGNIDLALFLEEKLLERFYKEITCDIAFILGVISASADEMVHEIVKTKIKNGDIDI